jgi:hypothetical protein
LPTEVWNYPKWPTKTNSSNISGDTKQVSTSPDNINFTVRWCPLQPWTIIANLTEKTIITCRKDIIFWVGQCCTFQMSPFVTEVALYRLLIRPHRFLQLVHGCFIGPGYFALTYFLKVHTFELCFNLYKIQTFQNLFRKKEMAAGKGGLETALLLIAIFIRLRPEYTQENLNIVRPDDLGFYSWLWRIKLLKIKRVNL